MLNHKLQQSQGLVLSFAMQKALEVLQMQSTELIAFLEKEIEENPALEPNFAPIFSQKRQGSSDSFSWWENCEKKPTLREHIIHELCPSQEDLNLLETIIAHLDERGYFTHNIELFAEKLDINEQKLKELLEALQKIEPTGIGAFNLRHSLLIQLEKLGKKQSMAYKLLDLHFDRLIQDKLDKSKAVQEALKEISLLNFFPTRNLNPEKLPPRIPDVYLFYEDGSWIIEVEEQAFPKIVFCKEAKAVFEIAPLKEEVHTFLKSHISRAEWLVRILERRRKTLYGLTCEILKKQHAFFEGKTKALFPMKMRAIAEELGLNHSTIARAVREKWLSTPIGLFPFKIFFSHTVTNQVGQELSARLIKEELAALVENEDKKKPYSDAGLSNLLEKKGYPCARRTVTKYREQLNIPKQKLRTRH